MDSFSLLPRALARSGLATRAEVAASPCYDYAADSGFTTDAGLAVALVHAVPVVEFAAVAVGINVIGNGRSAKADGFSQDFAHRRMKRQELRLLETRGDARRMDARAK